MGSRDTLSLQSLTRELLNDFLTQCQVVYQIDPLIYCMYRAPFEQAILYRQGRSLKKIQKKASYLASLGRPDFAQILLKAPPQYQTHRVTYAGPGQSLHQYGYAFDGVPIRNGKPVWGTEEPEDVKLWQQYGQAAREVGLEWAGDWTGKAKEYPHCQVADKKWSELIRNTLPLQTAYGVELPPDHKHYE